MHSGKDTGDELDALGSTVAVTNEKARVTARFEYDPYGARRSHPATDERYGFVGQEWVKDEPSDLMEMGVRFYDPGTGRFVGRDPLLTPSLGGEGDDALVSVRDFYRGSALARSSSGDSFLPEPGRYVYSGNRPIDCVDPVGLWYVDLNGTLGVGGGGATFGVQIGTGGVFLYAGPAAGAGIGGSLTWSPQNPCEGPAGGVQALQPGAGVSGQVGVDGNGEPFGEIGVGIGGGVVGSIYYVGQVTWPLGP